MTDLKPPNGVGDCFAPHCDQRVLHAPLECAYCDDYPAWQHYRTLIGVAFTGHEPAKGETPCPSDARRGTGQAHTWGGNRPTNARSPQEETSVSRVFYGGSVDDWPGRNNGR